jgi:hypothetical protein
MPGGDEVLHRPRRHRHVNQASPGEVDSLVLGEAGCVPQDLIEVVTIIVASSSPGIRQRGELARRSRSPDAAVSGVRRTHLAYRSR